MKFKYSNTNKRYYTLDYFFKEKFGCKVTKISLNGNFTCPNIDGTKGYGGCIYCSSLGSGDFAGSKNDDVVTQFFKVKEQMAKKWPKTKYIGYFQANSNTYANVDILKEKFEPILKIKDVIGLSIATRCDAISEEVLDYLDDLNKRTFLMVELGLQTIHESTSNLINRCHTLLEFEEMVKKLKKGNIHIVVHIINSLPYETKEMMLDTIRYLNKLKIDGIKIHMLHVLKNTKLEKMYLEDKFKLLSKEEYIELICDELEELDENIIVHRLTGDAKQSDLIAPNWTLKKIDVLNGIDKNLAKRNSYQGFNKSILNKVRSILELNLKEKDIVVDATVGNGNDTLFLANIVKKGLVIGFDIQNEAITRTNELLTKNNIKNYKLYNTGHENLEVINEYKKKISCFIYNLGYLPKSTSKIMTNSKSTITSIKKSLNFLNDKGFILITVYPHPEGKKEASAIKRLKLKEYKILEFHNTENENAPYLLYITK